MMAHPAGRRRSIGFQRVELAPAVLQQTGPEEYRYSDGTWRRSPPVVLRPPVYVLECHGCGVLFRIGSPHLLAHHQAHRRRTAVQRARAVISLAGHEVRRRLGKD